MMHKSEPGKGKSAFQERSERRPRKKLSFKDPEVEICHTTSDKRSSTVPRCRNVSASESITVPKSNLRLTSERLSSSLEDIELESQAMRIVRTIGQAFEVCHKLSLAHATSTVDSQEDIPCEKSNEALCETSNKGKPEVHRVPESNSCDTQMEDNRGASNESTVQRPTKLETLAPPASESGLRNASELGETYTSPLSEPLPLLGTLPPEGTPLSLYHQVQLLRHQLEQQSQQTQAAIAQVQLLKDQLSAETAARLEAQAQNHQLLVHNKELLDHIHVLVKQIQELEKKQQEGKADVVLPELPSVSEGVQPLHGRVTTTNSWHLPEIVPTTARSTSLDNTLNISQGYESRTPKDTVSFSSLQNSTSQLRTSSSPSGSPRLTSLTDEKTSLFLSGLPFTSSPTRLTFARTTDDILKSQRVDSSQSRTRSPSSSQPSEDSLSNLTSLQLGDSSATFPVPVSAPPQLNPPPQKLRNTKASEPAVTSKQGKVSTKSTGMDEIIGRSISYQETSQRPDLVSWPSSQFSTNQLTTSAIHASLSRQNSQPAYQYSEQDSYTTQIDRDIGRLNLQEKERDYLRISDSLFSQKDDSMQMLFKS